MQVLSARVELATIVSQELVQHKVAHRLLQRLGKALQAKTQQRMD